MDRRAFLATLAGGLLAVPLAATAQQPGKVWRVGFLSIDAKRYPKWRLPPALEEFGYIEGRNLILDSRWADGRSDRLRPLAAELIRGNPDVIVANLNEAIAAAKAATSSIPIVMANSLDPVEVGLVTSLARPGGNVTGMAIQAPQLTGKQLELLKQTVPGLRTVALLWEPAFPGIVAYYGIAQAAARDLDVTLRSFEVRQLQDIDGVLAAIKRARCDALYVSPTGPLFARYPLIIEFAAKNRLPAIYPVLYFVERGGLMSYGANLDATWHQVARYVDRILKGAKPANLPVEQPTKFELAINLKTARALGLTIPPSLLERADQVIE